MSNILAWGEVKWWEGMLRTCQLICSEPKGRTEVRLGMWENSQ